MFDQHLHQQPFSRKLSIDSNKAIGNKASQTELIQDYLQKFQLGYQTQLHPLQAMALYYYLEQTDSDAKVIHLFRDPRVMVRSFMNWKNRKLSGKVAHHLVPYWMPIPLQTGDLGLFDYAMLPKHAHFAWIWNFKNRLFSSLKGRPNYRLVKLEDLYASAGVMNELFQFMGVNAEIHPERHSKKANASQTKSFPRWRDWTPEMAKQLDRFCGPLMLELGYGTEPEWKALLVAK